MNKLKLIHRIITITFLVFALQIYPDSSESKEKKSIEEMIDQYFSTWSSQDMEGYESCFHSNAVIHFERNGEVREEKLTAFIDSQKRAHSFSFEKMKEIPLSKKIQIANNIAQVTVRWKLTSASREDYGYDYFTLIKHKKKWKIIYLIFNND